MPFIEIADFNRDGMLDLAFTTETGVLSILLNQFSSPGHKATNLCNDVGNTAELKSGGIFPSYPFTADKKGVIQASKCRRKFEMHSGCTNLQFEVTELSTICL